MNRSATRTVAAAGVALATILLILGIGVAALFNPPFVAFEQGRANVDGVDRLHARPSCGPRPTRSWATCTSAATSRDGPRRAGARPPRAGPHARRTGRVRRVLVAGRSSRRSRSSSSAGALSGGAWFWRADPDRGDRPRRSASSSSGSSRSSPSTPCSRSFHRIFFAGGTYLFDPRTERLVQLFPDQFWSETSIVLGDRPPRPGGRGPVPRPRRRPAARHAPRSAPRRLRSAQRVSREHPRRGRRPDRRGRDARPL